MGLPGRNRPIALSTTGRLASIVNAVSPFMGSTKTSAKEYITVDLLSYWQRVCVPFLRARFGSEDERGASLVEYALLVALIAVVCIVAISFPAGRRPRSSSLLARLSVADLSRN
jgi:hypothetical protein